MLYIWVLTYLWQFFWLFSCTEDSWLVSHSIREVEPLWVWEIGFSIGIKLCTIVEDQGSQDMKGVGGPEILSTRDVKPAWPQSSTCKGSTRGVHGELCLCVAAIPTSLPSSNWCSVWVYQQGHQLERARNAAERANR